MFQKEKDTRKSLNLQWKISKRMKKKKNKKMNKEKKKKMSKKKKNLRKLMQSQRLNNLKLKLKSKIKIIKQIKF